MNEHLQVVPHPASQPKAPPSPTDASGLYPNQPAASPGFMPLHAPLHAPPSLGSARPLGTTPGTPIMTVEQLRKLMHTKNPPAEQLKALNDQLAGMLLNTDEAPAAPGSYAWMAGVMEQVFEECRGLRAAGQKEYAQDDDNVFANFEDDAEASGIARELALTIFANKHWRGIRAWVRGHRSQRENVRGRINDMIVYLCLLRGMADQADALEAEAAGPAPVPFVPGPESGF